MKIFRNRVFETNSSSTHSITTPSNEVVIGFGFYGADY